MVLDPNIAMGYQFNDGSKIVRDAMQMRAFASQMQERQAETENRKRLADLLPRAARGDKNATDQIAGIDPEMFMKLDTHQRQQAKERTKDLAAAVRWADTPEKWEQVIDHYATEGVDLGKYRGQFALRERAILELGQISEYLESAPKNEATSMQRNYEFLKQTNPQLAEQYLQGQAQGSPIVQRNEDGTITVYPRSMLGGAGNAPPPPPGFVLDGGPTPPASGTFQP